MSPENEAASLIAHALRKEGRRQRRRTLLLSAVPVLVGVAAFVGVGFYVDGKRTELGDLEHHLERSILDLERIEFAKAQLREESEALEAEVAELQRETEQARLLLAQIERKLPEEARQETQLIAQGIQEIAKGEYGAASDSYQAALEIDPENELALIWQGEALSRKGQTEQAFANFDRALEIDPDLAETHYRRGLALFRNGDRDAGVDSIERAFSLDPSYKKRAYKDPGFLPVRDYMEHEQGAKSGKSDPEKELIDQALAEVRGGRLESAIAFYDQALELNPENAVVLNWKGYAQFRLGDLHGAIGSFDRAIEVDPDHAEAHYNRALALWRAEERDEAFRSIDRAFRADPSYEMRALQDPLYREIAMARRRAAG